MRPAWPNRSQMLGPRPSSATAPSIDRPRLETPHLNEAGSANLEGTGRAGTASGLVSVDPMGHPLKICVAILPGRGHCLDMQHALEKPVKRPGLTNRHNRCRRKFLDQQVAHLELARGIERIRCLRQENPVGPMEQHCGQKLSLCRCATESTASQFSTAPRMPCPFAQAHAICNAALMSSGTQTPVVIG